MTSAKSCSQSGSRRAHSIALVSNTNIEAMITTTAMANRAKARRLTRGGRPRGDRTATAIQRAKLAGMRHANVEGAANPVEVRSVGGAALFVVLIRLPCAQMRDGHGDHIGYEREK